MTLIDTLLVRHLGVPTVSFKLSSWGGGQLSRLYKVLQSYRTLAFCTDISHSLHEMKLGDKFLYLHVQIPLRSPSPVSLMAAMQ